MSAAAAELRQGRMRRPGAKVVAAGAVVGLVHLLCGSSTPSSGAFLGGLRPRGLPLQAPLAATRRRNSVCSMAATSVEVSGEVVPLGNHIFIKVEDADEVSKGGILLPKQDKPKAGEVMAVGPGDTNADTGVVTPVSVQVGAKVMYSSYAGSDMLDCDGVEHTLVREGDILVSYDGDEPEVDSLKMPRGRVLVRLLQDKEETSGGILLSQGAGKQDTTVGEVIAVGEGLMRADGEVTPPGMEPGDMVSFRFGDEVKLDIGDEKYTSVRISNCLAKWSPKLEEAAGDLKADDVKLPEGRLLVRLLKDKEETSSGILLSEGAGKQDTTVGEVVAVGPGRRQRDGEVVPLSVEPGDMVRFRWGDEVKLDVDDQEYTSVRILDCLAKWRPE